MSVPQILRCCQETVKGIFSQDPKPSVVSRTSDSGIPKSTISGGGENETFVSCDVHACHDRIPYCPDRFGAIDKDTQDPEAKTAADAN